MTTFQRTRSSPWAITNGYHPKNWKATGIPQRAVQGQERSAFRSLLGTLSWLRVSSAWFSATTWFLEFFSARLLRYLHESRDGRLVSLTSSQLFEQAFGLLPRLCHSPPDFLLLALMLMLFCHTLCLARYAPRDYCRLHRDQYDLGGKSRIVSRVGAWRLPSASSVNGNYIPRGRRRHRLCRASQFSGERSRV